MSEDERREPGELPEDPTLHPRETVDALEERLAGERIQQADGEDANDRPAHEQDLDADQTAQAREGDEPTG